MKVRKRLLLVAVLSAGIALASPALAYCPKQHFTFVQRNPTAAKHYAHSQLKKYGWDTKKEWQALVILWTHESNWRCQAYNSNPIYMGGIKYHAGGIPQKLGLSPKDSVEVQIKVGLDYIKYRYGSPVNALRFWDWHYWY